MRGTNNCEKLQVARLADSKFSIKTTCIVNYRTYSAIPILYSRDLMQNVQIAELSTQVK